MCLVPLRTAIFRGVVGQGALQTCFLRFHSCIDLRRQNDRSHEWLISGRNHDKRQSNKPIKKVATSNKDKWKPLAKKKQP